MKNMTAQEIIQLQADLEGLRSPFQNYWDELAAYMLPAKFAFETKHAEGEKRTYLLYDSTALMAVDDLAHYLSNALTPSHLEWFTLNFRNQELNQRDKAREWVDKVVRRMTQEFDASNFYAQAGEFNRDLPTFGTSAMGADAKYRYVATVKVFDGVSFDTCHMRDLVGMENNYGFVDTTIRTYERSASAWLSEFGADAPECVKKSVEAGKPTEKFKMLHAVYPRDPDDYEDGPGLIDPKKMRYASAWVSVTDKTMVREGGYRELPRTMVRWSTLVDSPYGYGPGMNALPDTRTLNEAKRLELDAYEKNLDPPMKTRHNNVVGDLEFKAGGVTVVRDMDGLARLFEGTNFNLSMVKSDELRLSIKQAFYNDLINTPADVTKQMTAYEVARRMERAQRILGEAIGRIRNEFLDWAVERMFGILMREGQLPEFPTELIQEFGDVRLDVEFRSPLHITQRAQALEQTTMFLSDLSGLAQVMAPQDPSQAPLWDHIDWDMLVKDMAERRNIPAAVIRDEEEVRKIRLARAVERAKAQQLAQAEAASNIIKNVGQGAGEATGQAVARGMEQGRPG
jgi:hypothetical protein